MIIHLRDVGKGKVNLDNIMLDKEFKDTAIKGITWILILVKQYKSRTQKTR